MVFVGSTSLKQSCALLFLQETKDDIECQSSSEKGKIRFQSSCKRVKAGLSTDERDELRTANKKAER